MCQRNTGEGDACSPAVEGSSTLSFRYSSRVDSTDDAPMPFDVNPDPTDRPAAAEAIDGGTLARAESGDRRAIERVLRTVHPSVHRVAHALAGEPERAADVMRFVFANAMRVLPQWSAWVDPETWFAHQAVQAVRRVCVGRPEVEHDLLVTALPPDAAATLPTDDWSQATGRTGIRSPAYLAFVRAVRRLPQQQVEAFVLHHGERLNARMLGVAMDCSAMAAETHLRAATAALQPLAGDDLPRLTSALHQAVRCLTPTSQQTDQFVGSYVGSWAGRRTRGRLRRLLTWVVFLGAVAAAGWVFRAELRMLLDAVVPSAAPAPSTQPATGTRPASTPA